MPLSSVRDLEGVDRPMRRSMGSRRKGGPSWHPLALACLGLLALAAPGCGGDRVSAADAEPTPKVTIVMKDGDYHPDNLQIDTGMRVTWVNASKDPQTAETPKAGFYEVDRRKLAKRGLFDIHTLQPGEAESLVFNRVGTYEYGSSYDTRMWGRIKVVESER
jgi:plastocyanin